MQNWKKCVSELKKCMDRQEQNYPARNSQIDQDQENTPPEN